MKVWCVVFENDIYRNMVRIYRHKKDAKAFIVRNKDGDYSLRKAEIEE